MTRLKHVGEIDGLHKGLRVLMPSGKTGVVTEWNKPRVTVLLDDGSTETRNPGRVRRERKVEEA